MKLLLLALPICLATVAHLYASDAWEEKQRLSLRGISAMEVIVENIRTDAVAAGLSGDQLQTDVGFKLRLAGIEVIPAPEHYDPRVPQLTVLVSYLKNATQAGDPIGYSCSIEIQFRQSATLLLNQNVEMVVSTWDRSSLSSGFQGDAQNEIRQKVGDLVDKFIHDYLRANPKC